MQKNIFIIALLLLPIYAFSQVTELSELNEKKMELREKIQVLEDSLAQVEKQIAFRKEQDPVELIPEPVVERQVKNFHLRIQPNDVGEIVMEIPQGTPVQEIDKIGEYYLVCLNGKCGYVHKNFMENPEEGTVAREDPGEVSMELAPDLHKTSEN